MSSKVKAMLYIDTSAAVAQIEELANQVEELRSKVSLVGVCWKPIDTAPVDQESAVDIMIYTNCHRMLIAQAYDGKINYSYRVGYAHEFGKPTHWMPLPKPPK